MLEDIVVFYILGSIVTFLIHMTLVDEDLSTSEWVAVFLIWPVVILLHAYVGLKRLLGRSL